MILRTLTDDGVAEFARYLAALKADPKLPPPFDLLLDKKRSAAVPGRIAIEDRVFASRFDLAAYLNDRLADQSIPNLDRHVGLWTWLTLFYFDQLCPTNGRGERKAGSASSYIPMLHDNRRYYRHLLYGPFAIFRLHSSYQDSLFAVLIDPLDVGTSEIYRMFIENSQILASVNAVRVANRLYLDEHRRKLKRGSGAKTNGGIRRYIDYMQQINLTYDIHSLGYDVLVNILPREFQPFLRS
jgi:hypothetical protein